MTIDIRAETTCNLGPLISASISDDYVQGNGLVKTSGNCEIAGVINPRMGTEIFFQYSTGSITKKIPKKLRVLSSFADPFRKITSIEFGCPLRYMEDVSEPVKLDTFGDSLNAGMTADDRKVVIHRSSAKWIGEKCLAAIGIEGDLPLMNIFTSEGPFDLSSGYVNVLSDLLISESYCGYIGPDGKLKVFSLVEPTGSGRLIGENDVIDIGPLNFGQLPGDSVTVNYSTLKLVGSRDEDEPEPDPEPDPEPEQPPPNENPYDDPKNNARLNWEEEEDTGFPEEIRLEGSTISRKDRLIPVKWEELYIDIKKTLVTTIYDAYDRVKTRTTTETSIAAAVNPKYVTQYRSWYGLGTAGDAVLTKRIVEEKFYVFETLPEPEPEPPPEGGDGEGGTTEKQETPAYSSTQGRPPGYDKVLRETRTVYEDALAVAASLPGNYYKFVPTEDGIEEIFYAPTGEIITEESEIQYQSFERSFFEYGRYLGTFPVTKTLQKRRQIFARTARGQNYFAELEKEGKGIEDMFPMAYELANQGSSVRIVSGREAVLENRPDRSTIIANTRTEGSVPKTENESTSSSPPVDEEKDGPRTEQKTETEVIYTSGKSGRKIEFNMPYAPDDYFMIRVASSGGSTNRGYFTVKSKASAKAALFGRVQNSLLMGNRHGINLQLPVDLMPHEPFSKLVVQAEGITGVYATNGTSWTIDPNGIIASTDALLLGVAGKA